MIKKSFFLLFLSCNLFSQNPSDIEHFYSYGTQEFRNIKTLAIQSDGKIIAGGGINNLSNRIYRFNVDGTLDKSFTDNSPEINGSINSIIIKADGKIVVGGKFNLVNGFIQNNLVILNSDGSLVSPNGSSNVNSGFNGEVLNLKSQSDGKILVCGRFTSYSSVSRNYIARLNTNGGLDNTFISYFDIDQGNTVEVLSIQTDGKILAGGNFTSFNNRSISRLIRLNSDGSKDESFSIGLFGFNAWVKSLAVKHDGKILVGGWFDKYNAINQNYIVCLNPNGSKDDSFSNETSFNASVESIIIQPDGKIILGGFFNKYKNISQNGICRLNPDGTIDSSFNSPFGLNSYVNSIALFSDGKILVGGNFVTEGLVRLYGTSSILSDNEFYSLKNNFLIYPNPVKDVLNIDSLIESDFEYEIFNSQGKKVLNSKSFFRKIDLSNLKQGIYFLKIDNNQNKNIYKFIKE
ncbi:T9SS type A sorting domain-containing protein [Polaribacter sp.]|uniref:T9SS type A sorting domain-containing protein n=1 Tax=Polaribacter sp. TaxID=1920175 RepID=UPI004048C1FA